MSILFMSQYSVTLKAEGCRAGSLRSEVLYNLLKSAVPEYTKLPIRTLIAALRASHSSLQAFL